MMRRWHSLLDIISFPLKVLFSATILMGIGGLLLNPNVNSIIPIENQLIITFAQLFRYFGSLMILNFPFFILIKALSKRYTDSIPVFIGVVGYLIFNITTMFFAKTNLVPEAYSAVFGIQVSPSFINTTAGGVLLPLHTGMIGAIIIIIITRISFLATRRMGGYGIFSFIDKDVWGFLYTSILSMFAGIAIAYTWPGVLMVLEFIFRFIRSDITNPMNLFIYGLSDRILGSLSLSQLIRAPFWFKAAGGSWIGPDGINYLGDVGIWTKQVMSGMIPKGFGRFITPYYVLNLFAIPAFIAGIFRTFTDKLERKKFRAFYVVAILLSIFVGFLLPFELFLLFVTPMLYVVHIFITGLLFAIFQALNVSLGYTFTGIDLVATPASVVDLLVFVRNPSMQTTIITIVIVGIVVAFTYYMIARLYFTYFAYDALNVGHLDNTVEELFTVFGGIDNIRMVHSSFYQLKVLPMKKAKVDFGLAPLKDVTKIVEGKSGFILTLGSGSYIIRNKMIKIIKDHQRELLMAKQLKSKIENVD